MRYLFRDNTPHGVITVSETPFGLVLCLDGHPQSYSGQLPQGYHDYYRKIVNAIPSNATSVLLYGVAGGTIGRLLRLRGYTGILNGIEPWGLMRHLGERFFDTLSWFDAILPTEPPLPKYDCVIDDAYDALEKQATDAWHYVRRGGRLISNVINDDINDIEILTKR